MSQESSERKYLDTEEAADYMRLKKETLEVWRVHGRGPRFYRVGRRVIYSIKDIDDFIGESVGSTSECRK